MKFHKVYIEISNICNLQCTFCPEVGREKKILSPDNFRKILKEILPFTEFITLHLMGEPLGHPQFLEILQICEQENAKVHLTTNGTLLAKFNFSDLLKYTSIYQINFSVHSFADNYPDKDIKAYLYDILLFSKEALKERPDLYINYRLWNLFSSAQEEERNQSIIEYVTMFFQESINPNIDVRFKKSKNILGRIYFHFDSRFNWPSPFDPIIGNKGFCHALGQQIGIHADGQIVPCCLDKEANISLGNIFEKSFVEILQSERLVKMRNGFKNHQLTEDLCQKCTYIKRFDNKIKR